MSKKSKRPIDPIKAKRPVLRNEDWSPVTVDLPHAATVAIHDVLRAHRKAMRKALAPFGLHPNDIAMPQWKRVVHRDEELAQAIIAAEWRARV